MAKETAPRALLLDWDSTLADNWRGIQLAINTALEAFGQQPWSRDQVIANAARSQRDTFPRLFGPDAEAAKALFYRRLNEVHIDMLSPLPGAEDLLTGLAARGWPMAIVSNKGGDVLRREVAALGWAGYFGAVIGALDAQRDKPDAAPARLALQRLAIPPAPGVWFVGDSETDLACAQAAGCRQVLLETNPAPPPHSAMQPDALRFADCHALLRFVERLF